MAKGLGGKVGRVLQFIYQTSANLFNPNGKRVVASNAEDYDFVPAIEFDKLSRKGSKALVANVPLEEMWQGRITGPLHYNLIDDQILPFWIGKPFSSTPTTVNAVSVIDTEYRRPQDGRADREVFAVEEGIVGQTCDLGCHGLLSSFKWTSKRGNNGKSRFEANFVTQAAIQRNSLTGGTVQNSVLQFNANNVSADGVFAITKPNSTAQNLTLSIGDTTAQTVAKLAAIGITATVVGTVSAATGENHRVTATNALGNATVYSTITITPGMTAAALQAAIRALGGNYANVTVTGSTTALAPNVMTGGTPSSPGSGNPVGNVSDGDLNTSWGIDSQDQWWQYIFTAAKTIKFVTVTVTDPSGFDAMKFYASATGPSGDRFTEPTDKTLIGNFASPTTGWTDLGGGKWQKTFTLTNNTAYAYFWFWMDQKSGSGGNNVLDMKAYESDPAGSNGFYDITFPNGVGNVADITATPGTGWSTQSTQPGNAGGAITVTVTSPANAPVTVAFVSGAGWTGSTTTLGADGSIIGSMLPEMPIMPGHITIYSADTAAGLDDAGALIGLVQEWELDDPKICIPVSHHVPIVDPLRPNLPATYDSFAEEETETDSVKLSVTLDTDESGVVPALVGVIRSNGTRIVSKPRYWRLVAQNPGSVEKVTVEFYGSVGNSAEIKFAGVIEQRTLVFDLIENRSNPWNFRVITRRKA